MPYNKNAAFINESMIFCISRVSKIFIFSRLGKFICKLMDKELLLHVLSSIFVVIQNFPGLDNSVLLSS